MKRSLVFGAVLLTASAMHFYPRRFLAAPSWEVSYKDLQANRYRARTSLNPGKTTPVNARITSKSQRRMLKVAFDSNRYTRKSL